MSEYQEGDPHVNYNSHPILEAIKKFRNHPRVTAIKYLNNVSIQDSFCRVSVEDTVKEIKTFNTRKTTQSTDLPVKILKENSDV